MTHRHTLHSQTEYKKENFMKRDIKNSHGKVTGYTEILEDHILIDNYDKPILEITEESLIQKITQGVLTDEILIQLYNDFTLTTGEIASLYSRPYSNINKILKKIPTIKFDKRGRRNRAYGHHVSQSQSEKMSKALKGRAAPKYERTPEIRQKISKTLKEYYKTHPQDPAPHIRNWEQGVYDEVDFRIGIGGHFTSLKNNTKIHFRSLLELSFLILLEEDPRVTKYSYEPFHIKMDNKSTYTPDFLINDKIVVELKAKKYVERVAGVKEKFLYKKEQAEVYCARHNLEYRVIYDEDVGFESKKMKYFISNHPEIIEKFQISFSDPKRMVTK